MRDHRNSKKANQSVEIGEFLDFDEKVDLR